MRILGARKTDWMYPLRRKLLLGILGIMVVVIIVAMISIATMLRQSLVKDSAARTQEIGDIVNSSLKSLMLVRNPGMIQDTLENIGGKDSSVVRALIIDKNGMVIYSSDGEEIGKALNKYNEKACQGCHLRKGVVPFKRAVVIKENGELLHRNVDIIYNEKSCYGCHAKSDRINGKLIIDRSLKASYALISSVELIIFGSGIISLVLLVPFLSRVLSGGIGKYMHEIDSQNIELGLLYVMTERLSRTIDLEELKPIVVDIMKGLVSADEVDLITPNTHVKYKVTTWKKETNLISRKKLNEGEPLYLLANEWLAGRLNEGSLSEDGKQIYLPISKSDKNIALIVATKKIGAFERVTSDFLRAVAGHMAVAFENAMLYQTAITDELTGLYSPRHFRASIEKKCSDSEDSGGKLTLFLFDIDDFKKVNDTYGHLAGDSVLKELARRVRGSIREADLAFRYGGEEFAVILPSTDSQNAKPVAERVRKAIADEAFLIETLSLRVTISIGVSTCPDNARLAKDLIQTADEALYRAKGAGKNRVIAYESMTG